MNNEIFHKMYLCRKFELMVAELIKGKHIEIPTYLSIGQEHVPAIVSYHFPNSYVFPQHRCHSWYLCYGGNPTTLLKQLLGIQDVESNGMQGSASIAIPGKMFGHSGLLGDQIPIAVGFADAKRQHTICVAGDAAVEEDYALGALGYAGTHKVPILFIVEDNNLSILTEKKVRRSWDIVDVAESLGVDSERIGRDICAELFRSLWSIRHFQSLDAPKLLDIPVERHYWHAGAGQDGKPKLDYVASLQSKWGDKEEMLKIDNQIEELWELSQKLSKI